MSRIRTELAASAVSAAAHQSDGWHQRFCLPESFAGFAGHFPDNPVVPAVVQILMGLLVAEAAAARCLEITQVSRAKFLQPLRPQQAIDVRCAPGGDDRTWEVEVRGAGGVAAMFRLQLTEAIAEEGR